MLLAFWAGAGCLLLLTVCCAFSAAAAAAAAVLSVCPPGFHMPKTGSTANTCVVCPLGSFCLGGNKKASSGSDDMGTPKTCNNIGSQGLTTKATKATKPTDCGE